MQYTMITVLIPLDIISFFFDNVLLNYEHGVPLLKDWLLSYLLLKSNGSICPKGLHQNKPLIKKSLHTLTALIIQNKPFKFPQTNRKNLTIISL